MINNSFYLSSVAASWVSDPLSDKGKLLLITRQTQTTDIHTLLTHEDEMRSDNTEASDVGCISIHWDEWVSPSDASVVTDQPIRCQYSYWSVHQRPGLSLIRHQMPVFSLIRHQMPMLSLISPPEASVVTDLSIRGQCCHWSVHQRPV